MLELISDDGENQLCPLSCGVSGDLILSRNRRAETDLAPLSFVLTASGSKRLNFFYSKCKITGLCLITCVV